MLVAIANRNKIPDILKAKNWSIYRLAKEVDMDYKSIYTLVNSDAIPAQTHYDTVRKVAGALGVSVEDLEEKQ